MIVKRKRTAEIAFMILVAAMLTVAMVVHAEDNSCSQLLTHGIYDTVEFSGSEMERRRVYNYVCNESQKLIVKGDASEINIGFMEFSLGARLDLTTAEGYYDKYCTQNEDTLFGSKSHNVRIKEINDKAIASWSACIDSANRGIEIHPDINEDETRVRFQLRRTSGDDHTLRGIDSRIFECKMGGTKIDEEGLNGVEIAIGGTFVNFTCTRTEAQMEHALATYYSGGDIVVDLSTGLFVIDFGERVTGPLGQRLVEIENRTRELATLVANVPSGTIVAWHPQQTDPVVPPQGWLICDGNNGTPDLQDMFIFGTTKVAEVGTIGGHVEHFHTGRTSHIGASSGEDDGSHPRTGPHFHTFETSVDSSLPPFLKLIYIMKK